jgi:hypothetical protein
MTPEEELQRTRDKLAEAEAAAAEEEQTWEKLSLALRAQASVVAGAHLRCGRYRQAVKMLEDVIAQQRTPAKWKGVPAQASVTDLALAAEREQAERARRSA